MWNLKDKQTKNLKYNRIGRVIETENKQVVALGKVHGG